MSPAARTVVSMQLSQLVQESKLCHRRAAARPLSRTSDKPSRPCGNSLRPPRALLCPLNVKRCLPEAPASNDVYLTRHQAWITCQNLPGPPSAFLCGVKGHTWNYCAEEGEPGDEAKYCYRITSLYNPFHLG